jgi:hypothetical protein
VNGWRWQRMNCVRSMESHGDGRKHGASPSRDDGVQTTTCRRASQLAQTSHSLPVPHSPWPRCVADVVARSPDLPLGMAHGFLRTCQETFCAGPALILSGASGRPRMGLATARAKFRTEHENVRFCFLLRVKRRTSWCNAQILQACARH